MNSITFVVLIIMLPLVFSSFEHWLTSRDSTIENKFKNLSITPKALPKIARSHEPTPRKKLNCLQENKDTTQSNIKNYAHNNKFRQLLHRNAVLVSESPNHVSISPYSKNLSRLNANHYSQLASRIDLLPPIERHKFIGKLKTYPEMLEKFRSLSPTMKRAQIVARPSPRNTKKYTNKMDQILSQNSQRVEVDASLQIATMKKIVSRVKEYKSPCNYMQESFTESNDRMEHSGTEVSFLLDDRLICDSKGRQKIKDYPIMFQKLELLSPDVKRAQMTGVPAMQTTKKPTNTRLQQLLSGTPPLVSLDMSLQIETFKEIGTRVREYESIFQSMPQCCRDNYRRTDIPFSPPQLNDHVLSGWCETPDTDATNLTHDDMFTPMDPKFVSKKKK